MIRRSTASSTSTHIYSFNSWRLFDFPVHMCSSRLSLLFSGKLSLNFLWRTAAKWQIHWHCVVFALRRTHSPYVRSLQNHEHASANISFHCFFLIFSLSAWPRIKNFKDHILTRKTNAPIERTHNNSYFGCAHQPITHYIEPISGASRSIDGQAMSCVYRNDRDLVTHYVSHLPDNGAVFNKLRTTIRWPAVEWSNWPDSLSFLMGVRPQFVPVCWVRTRNSFHARHAHLLSVDREKSAHPVLRSVRTHIHVWSYKVAIENCRTTQIPTSLSRKHVWRPPVVVCFCLHAEFKEEISASECGGPRVCNLHLRTGVTIILVVLKVNAGGIRSFEILLLNSLENWSTNCVSRCRASATGSFECVR